MIDIFNNINVDDLSKGKLAVNREEGEQIVAESKEDIKQSSEKKEDNKSNKKVEEPLQLKVNVRDEDEQSIEDNTEDIKKNNPVHVSENSSSITPFAAALIEQGIISSLNIDEFAKLNPEQQAETLMKSYDDEVNNRINNWVTDLPPKLRKIIDDYTEGVPLDKIIEIDSKKSDYSSIKVEDLDKNETLSKKLISDNLLAEGYSKEEIEEHLDSLVDYTKPAKIALKKLNQRLDAEIEKEKVSTKHREEAERKQSEDSLKVLYNTIEKTEELIPGMKLNKKVKEELIDLMTIPKSYDKQGRPISVIAEARSKNPIDFEMKLNYLFMITKGFEDFSKINTTMKTIAVKELAEKLKTEDTKRTAGGSSVNFMGEKNTDLLNSIRGVFK